MQIDITLPILLHLIPDHLQLYSSVGIGTGLWDGRPRNRGSIAVRSNRFFFPKCTDPTQRVPKVKRLEPETSDLVLTSRISGDLTPLPRTSSWPASIPRRIMCCGIHPEDDGNTVCRKV